MDPVILILTALKQTESDLANDRTHENDLFANFCERLIENIKFFMEEEKEIEHDD